jgi:hypothetical protein
MPNPDSATSKFPTGAYLESAAHCPQSETFEIIDRLLPIAQILAKSAAAEYAAAQERGASSHPNLNGRNSARPEIAETLRSAVTPSPYKSSQKGEDNE